MKKKAQRPATQTTPPEPLKLTDEQKKKLQAFNAKLSRLFFGGK